jgi:hypothetical protein
MSVDTTNLIYIYDEAVVLWLKSLDFDSEVNESVTVKYQAMNKVFSRDVPEEVNTVYLEDLPVVVIGSFDPQLDLSRRQTGSFKKWDVVEENDQSVVYKEFDYPKPFKITYQIDIWTRYKSHMNQILQKLLLDFDANIKYLTPNLGNIMKTKYMKLELIDISDNSDLEFSTKFESTKFRKTISIDSDVWLFKDKYPNLIKRIQSIDTSFKDSNKNDTIEQNVVIEKDE